MFSKGILNLLNFKEYADKNSSSYKKNYEDICKYKEQLHSDLSEFIKVCDNYEKMQKEYENEKNTIIKTNENLINYKKIKYIIYLNRSKCEIIF